MFLKGVIEGFYGRAWSWQARHSWVEWIARTTDSGCYVYAPKSENYLRNDWRQDWPRDRWLKLQELSQKCGEHKVRFGVGLSPTGISAGQSELKMLQHRVTQLAQLGLDLLCLLHDDSEPPEDSANTQLASLGAAMDALDKSTRVLFCPTWYSFDPRLISLYGKPPPDYYETIGAGLPASVDVLWTGHKVCTYEHDAAHWERISAQLGRKPVLWDNSVANDGAEISQHLMTRPFPPSWCFLGQWSSGVLLNPMNQPYVAQLLFAHMVALLDGSTHGPSRSAPRDDDQGLWRSVLRETCSESLVAYLERDGQLFCDNRLRDMPESERSRRERQYRALDEPVARDIADWLAGEYAFDPACLT